MTWHLFLETERENTQDRHTVEDRQTIKQLLNRAFCLNSDDTLHPLSHPSLTLQSNPPTSQPALKEVLEIRDKSSVPTRDLVDSEKVKQLVINHVTKDNVIKSHEVENTIPSSRKRPSFLALSPVPDGNESTTGPPSPAPYISVMRGDSPGRRASPARMSPKTSPGISPKISPSWSPKISPINRNSPFPKLTTELGRDLRKSQRKTRKGNDEVTPPPPPPPPPFHPPSDFSAEQKTSLLQLSPSRQDDLSRDKTRQDSAKTEIDKDDVVSCFK